MGRHQEDGTAPGARSQDRGDTGRRSGRARRHLLVAGFVLGYLAAGGVTLALGGRVAGGGWLALHLLLGAATNAIWSGASTSPPRSCGPRPSPSGWPRAGRWP
jgi:hypothetical protein